MKLPRSSVVQVHWLHSLQRNLGVPTWSWLGERFKDCLSRGRWGVAVHMLVILWLDVSLFVYSRVRRWWRSIWRYCTAAGHTWSSIAMPLTLPFADEFTWGQLSMGHLPPRIGK